MLDKAVALIKELMVPESFRYRFKQPGNRTQHDRLGFEVGRKARLFLGITFCVIIFMLVNILG
jgi:hypothetical protein